MKKINHMPKLFWFLLISGTMIAVGGLGLPINSLHQGTSLLARDAHADDSKLKAGMVDPKTGKKIKYWVAPMDPTYIRNEPGKSPMGMDMVPVYEEEGGEKTPTSTIRIDPVTIQNMGVRIKPVERKRLNKTIRTFGNITYDEAKIFTVNTKFSGWIEKLYVNFEGEKVRKGQPLFEVYSPEVVSAQEEYLLAFEQFKGLSSSSYPAIRENAKNLLDAARTRLRYWDLNAKQIQAIKRSGKPKKTITFFSPATGVVTKKMAYEGHMVKAGDHQYIIANLSNIWVDVEVYEYELPWIKKGMAAEMELPYIPGKRFKGKVLFIYPYLSAKTRTARLRLSFPNPNYNLKPDMYADIYLHAFIAEDSVVIPQEAVIDSGERKVVFVSLGKGKFEPREITIGVEGNDFEFQVLNGLKEGEQIVVSGQFMLDSESRLREAIEKMLETKKTASRNKGKQPSDDVDMSGMSMDNADELNMDDMTMDN